MLSRNGGRSFQRSRDWLFVFSFADVALNATLEHRLRACIQNESVAHLLNAVDAGKSAERFFEKRHRIAELDAAKNHEELLSCLTSLQERRFQVFLTELLTRVWALVAVSRAATCCAIDRSSLQSRRRSLCISKSRCRRLSMRS